MGGGQEGAGAPRLSRCSPEGPRRGRRGLGGSCGPRGPEGAGDGRGPQRLTAVGGSPEQPRVGPRAKGRREAAAEGGWGRDGAGVAWHGCHAPRAGRDAERRGPAASAHPPSRRGPAAKARPAPPAHSPAWRMQVYCFPRLPGETKAREGSGGYTAAAGRMPAPSGGFGVGSRLRFPAAVAEREHERHQPPRVRPAWMAGERASE